MLGDGGWSKSTDLQASVDVKYLAHTDPEKEKEERWLPEAGGGGEPGRSCLMWPSPTSQGKQRCLDKMSLDCAV